MTRREWLACCFGVWIATLQAAEPARIVSTSPSITETLFALGLGDRVVGVSTLLPVSGGRRDAAEGRHVPPSGRRGDRAASTRSRDRPCRTRTMSSANSPSLGIPIGHRRSRHAAQRVFLHSRHRRRRRAPAIAPSARRRACSGVSIACARAVAGRPRKKVLADRRSARGHADRPRRRRPRLVPERSGRHRRRRERPGRTRPSGVSAHLDGDGDSTGARRHRGRGRHGRHAGRSVAAADRDAAVVERADRRGRGPRSTRFIP